MKKMKKICSAFIILRMFIEVLPLEGFSFTTLQQRPQQQEQHHINVKQYKCKNSPCPIRTRRPRICTIATTSLLLSKEGGDERGTSNSNTNNYSLLENTQPELVYNDEDANANIQNTDTHTDTPDTAIATEFLPTFILLWVVALLSSLDRVAMSVAILPMSSEYYFTDTIKGEISSVFSLGYGLGVIPCGLIAAFVSPRKIMAFGVFLWSLATFGTPIAASLIQIVTTSATPMTMPEQANIDIIDTTMNVSTASTIFVATNIAPLLLTRAVMGSAESVVMPANQKFLANWVPKSKKTIAFATITSGFQIGTVTAYLLSPWVIENFMGGTSSWRGLFYVYGAVGALWLIPWAFLSNDAPEEKLVVDSFSSLSSSSSSSSSLQNEGDVNSGVIDVNPDMNSNMSTNYDKAPLSAIDEAITTIKEAPWKTFAQSEAVWGMIIAHAANNWGLYNLLSWTPYFFAEEYNLNVKDSALFSVFPSIAAAVCGLSAGFLADKLISSMASGGSTTSTSTSSNDDTEQEEQEEIARTNVRKAFQGLALLGPAACLLVLSNHIPENPLVAQVLLMGTAGLQALHSAGFGVAPQEKAGEKWAGLLYGITTLPGVVFGSFGVYVTGQVLDLTNQNWSQVYSINAVVDIIGALAFIALYDSKKEFD